MELQLLTCSPDCGLICGWHICFHGSGFPIAGLRSWRAFRYAAMRTTGVLGLVGWGWRVGWRQKKTHCYISSCNSRNQLLVTINCYINVLITMITTTLELLRMVLLPTNQLGTSHIIFKTLQCQSKYINYYEILNTLKCLPVFKGRDFCVFNKIANIKNLHHYIHFRIN